MRAKRVFPLLVLIALTAAGCATTGASHERSGRNMLTRADIEASMQVNALEAIRQARPMWLRVRGPNSFSSPNPIIVYVDGMRSGGVQTLEGIPALAVERMRFYDGSEAQARFGLNHTNGAIEVITRSQ